MPLNQKRLAELDLPGLAPSFNLNAMLMQETNVLHAIEILDARTKELAKQEPVQQQSSGLDDIPSGMDEEPDGEPIRSTSTSTSPEPVSTEYDGPFAVTLSGNTAYVAYGIAYFNGRQVQCSASSGISCAAGAGYIILSVTMTNADKFYPSFSYAYSFSATLPSDMPVSDLSTSTPSSVTSSIALAYYNGTSVKQYVYGTVELFAFATLQE